MPSSLQIISLFVCVLLLIGYLNRSRKRLHIGMMLSALTIDLGLVLYLEITRAVVESIPGRAMTPLLLIHITLSTIVLILYGVQVVTGIRKARGRASTTHARIPFWFMTPRLGNLLTSFLIV